MLERLSLPAITAALALCGVACVAPAYVAVEVPIAPEGVEPSPDVAAGYAAFSDALAPLGAWEGDAMYAVRWCPRAETLGMSPERFQPYRDGGHWAASERAIGDAPAGSPTWISEPPSTWAAITMHHGWWVRAGGVGADRSWCWVPGAEETAGRVVWREGDGFVGWAPEAPAALVVDDVDYEALDWIFCFLGALYEPDVDAQVLYGDAAVAAASVTAPGAASGAGPAPMHYASPTMKHIGPAPHLVHAAHAELSAYAALHALELAAKGKKPAPSSAGSSSGSSDDTDDEKRAAAKAKITIEVLPPGMVYYDLMLANPMVGPAPITPQLPSPVAYGDADDSPAGSGPAASSDHAASEAVAGRAWGGGAGSSGAFGSSGASAARSTTWSAPSSSASRLGASRPSAVLSGSRGGSSLRSSSSHTASRSSHSSSSHSSSRSSHSSSSHSSSRSSSSHSSSSRSSHKRR